MMQFIIAIQFDIIDEIKAMYLEKQNNLEAPKDNNARHCIFNKLVEQQEFLWEFVFWGNFGDFLAFTG